MTESCSSWSVWTACDVQFAPYPTEQYDTDEVLEILVEHYYERPAFVRRFIAPSLGWCPADGFLVRGLPWWMPRWWARRELLRLFTRQGIAGQAKASTVTNSLQVSRRD